MPATSEEFRLSPQEDWIFGVGMRGGSLVFGPSGSVVAMACFGSLFMAGFGILMMLTSSSDTTLNGYTVENPAAMVVLGAVALGFSIWYLVASLLVGLRADEEGLTIRRLVRRRRVPWDTVAAVRAHETAPERWVTFWGPNIITWQMRPVASWSIGVLEMAEGVTVRLPGFEAAARGDGLSLGLPTATEIKVQALRRYMSHVTGRPLDTSTELGASIPEDEETNALLWFVLGSFGVLAGWLLVSWAAGTFVSPALLVIALLFGAFQFARRRRVG